MKDGRIDAQGIASEVLGKTESLKEEAAKDEAALEKADDEVDDTAAKKSGKLIVEEEMEEGHVGWSARMSATPEMIYVCLTFDSQALFRRHGRRSCLDVLLGGDWRLCHHRNVQCLSNLVDRTLGFSIRART